jgi:mitochondrial intermediate peptidase
LLSKLPFFSAELCRNVHPNPDISAAANKAYTLVSAMTVGFNADRSLYEPLLRLHDSNAVLSKEQTSMLTSLKVDFERGGINLPHDERKRVADLQNLANALGAQFTSNIASASGFIEVERAKLLGFPPHLLAQLQRRGSRAGSVCIAVSDSAFVASAMKCIESADVREKVFRAEHSRCAPSNVPVLDRLLEARHAFANILGFNSYAGLTFPGRLASSPEDVLAFLDTLSSQLQPAASREDQVVGDAKARDGGYSHDGHVEPWDRSHYMGRAKAKAFELDSGVLSEYLPLDACLIGMASVMRKVFGVSMVSVPRAECKSELWHADVAKMELRHETDGVLGHVFLDLYPRPGKYGHAAHFCLQCGRDAGDGSEYHTPVVALVCNFAPSSKGAPALLSFAEYETLWHEWGHAMHSLLSRTRYQHLSGTRVSPDLVEVPSHVFEHFAWDPRVLSHVSSHYRTGDPMPTRLIHAICASRYQFVASDLQFQTMYSSMDLVFHGPHPPVGRTSEVASQLQNRLTNVRYVEGTAPHAAFQHFVGYGAGYYSCSFLLFATAYREAFPSDSKFI